MSHVPALPIRSSPKLRKKKFSPVFVSIAYVIYLPLLILYIQFSTGVWPHISALLFSYEIHWEIYYLWTNDGIIKFYQPQMFKTDDDRHIVMEGFCSCKWRIFYEVFHKNSYIFTFYTNIISRKDLYLCL